MTARPDAELVALFCERVLGWHRGAYGDWFDSADRFVRSAIYPLHSHDDAFAGLRAHPEWAWHIQGPSNKDSDPFSVAISFTLQFQPDPDQDFFVEEDDPDLCRAIVLACLAAVGMPA